MSRAERWKFDDGELPRWARASESKPENPEFSWRTIPAPTPLTPATFVARSLIWRLVITGLLALCIFCGALWQNSSALLSAVGTAFVAGIYLAVIAIFSVLPGRLRAGNLRSMGLDPGYPEGPLWVPVVFFPLAAALFVFVCAVGYRLFPQPFTAVLLLAPLAFFLQVRVGGDVLAFAREKLSISEWIDREEREKISRVTTKPDLRTLAICLIVVLLVPAFFSTTAGILVLVGGLAYFLTDRLRHLQKYGKGRQVLAGLLLRAQQTVTDYCDYAPTESFHWKPRYTRLRRFWSFLAATWALDLVFLVGLCGFFPWEFAAGLSVKGYSLPGSILTHYQTGRYQWILTPLELATKADPPGLYLACLGVALPLFIVVTPATLLVTHLPELIKLENLAQRVKKRARS